MRRFQALQLQAWEPIGNKVKDQAASKGPASVERLSECLYEEGRALEELLFKLEEEHLVLASGRHAWLPRATAEVEGALAALDGIERSRHRIMEELAGAVPGVAGAVATLSDVAMAFDDPWRDAILAQRSSLKITLSRVQDVITRNRDYLAMGLAATVEALGMLGAHSGISYDSDGVARPVPGTLRLVDAAF